MAISRNPCRYCASSFYDDISKRRSPSLSKECKECEWLKEHRQYLQSKRKFIEGRPITTFEELLKNEWVMLFHKTKHIEIIKHAQLSTVLEWLNCGAIHEAIKKEEKEN